MILISTHVDRTPSDFLFSLLFVDRPENFILNFPEKRFFCDALEYINRKFDYWEPQSIRKFSRIK